MSAEISVPIKILPHGAGLPIPAYASAQAAGADLVAALPPGEPRRLAPGERTLVATGIALALPADYEAQVRPRSGLALRYGITLLNAPGTIDADYRGEIFVLLVNLGSEPVLIKRGMRIAQLILAPVSRAAFFAVSDLDKTERHEGGFGSTGFTIAPEPPSG